METRGPEVGVENADVSTSETAKMQEALGREWPQGKGWP
jgi:hypothetical protein